MYEQARNRSHSELWRVSFEDIDESQVKALGLEGGHPFKKLAAFEAVKDASFLRFGCLGVPEY